MSDFHPLRFVKVAFAASCGDIPSIDIAYCLLPGLHWAAATWPKHRLDGCVGSGKDNVAGRSVGPQDYGNDGRHPYV